MANRTTRTGTNPPTVNLRRPDRAVMGLVALLFLIAGSRDAAAQEGVILEVTIMTAEETFPTEAVIGAQLGPEGVDVLMSALIAAGQGSMALGKLRRAMSGKPDPEMSTMEYTVYLRDDLMALAAKGMPIMVWDVTDPGMSKMWFIDPATGRPLTLPGTDREGIRLGDVEATAVDERVLASEIVPTGATREMLGYTAHEYTYKVSLIRKMRGMGPDFAVHIEGEAWVAPTSPFREEVAAFYRNFAGGIGEPGASGQTGHLGGLSAHMADIAELGVPLRNSEGITTLLIQTGADGNPTGVGVPISRASSTSIVKSLSRAPIGDERFYGAGPDSRR